jgi:putative nucleotidyltransferase with HDIG domain
MLDDKKAFDIRRLMGLLAQWRGILFKVAIAVVLTLVLAGLYPRGESIELDYRVGAVWAQKDLIAPFSFPIFREERDYARDVDAAKLNVYDVFERDTLAETQQLRSLNTFFGRLREASAAFTAYRRSAKRHRLSAAADSLRFARSAAELEIPFSEREWEIVASLEAQGELGRMEEAIGAHLKEILRTGILDRPRSDIRLDHIALRKGTEEEILPANRLYVRSDIVAMLEKVLQTTFSPRNDEVRIAYKIGITTIEPNVRYKAAATDLALAAAVDAVPRTLGFVQENERVVSKHERITPETKLKLESLGRIKAEREPESDNVLQFIGTLLHVCIVVMLYGIYLYLFRKLIAGNTRRIALIALLIMMEGFFAYLTRELDVNAPIEYLIFVPAASMLLTIIFDSRVGFYGTVIIAYLVAGIRGNDYSVALAALVAGSLAVYTVRDIKNRTQIFRSLGFIFLGYALTILALGFERFESFSVVMGQMTFALVNAVVSPMLTFGLLIFLEKVFRVTTDVTLMELAHFKHPLLRMLAEQAPGTYQHSVTMASLAEAGAVAVGANEVLARVGAYFHDIGKIVKPTYFVENQKSSRSRHDKLSPRMSSLIIAAHVKDGIALAQEYNLPEEVIDFIPMHHGTTRIDYFYSKAMLLAENSPDETKVDEIKEQDYRYPGPRPQTKETGIMMLADAIEAAVRTIDEPTPQRLEVVINEIIKNRFEQGELDECPLTLKDLTKIKVAFHTMLVGIYHSRVKYPATERKRSRPVQQPETLPNLSADDNGEGA